MTDGKRLAIDGYRLATKWCNEGILKSWYWQAAIREIDRLTRKRMAEAWDQGWTSAYEKGHPPKNPYRGRGKP